jgi:glucose/arabinose dehydrogenase
MRLELRAAAGALLVMLGVPAPGRAGSDPAAVDPTAPRAPPNFTVAAYARGLTRPGALLVLPNGDVLVAVTDGVTLLRDGGGEGVADAEVPLVTGIGRPLGLALRRDKLYVATAEALHACVYLVGRLRLVGHCRPVATWPDEAGVPLPGGVAFNRDETVLHAALAGGTAPAGVWALQPGAGPKHRDARREATLAAGALALEPLKGALWTVDAAGLLTAVGDRTTEPALPLGPHGGVTALSFYGRDRYPKEFRGGLFVAEGGDGEAAPARISFVPYQAARPAGPPGEFAGAFHGGHPDALAVARDGALLVADSARGTIWRVAFRCAACTPDPGPAGRRRR